jgi:hypothetical protein
MSRFRLACWLAVVGLCLAAMAGAQVNIPSLLNLHADLAPVRYSPGSLDRAAHVQARLEALARDFSKWGTQRYVLQGYVLAPEDWAAAGLRRPYGLPERSGPRGIAAPAWGDEQSVALWRKLLGGELPWTGDMPVRGTNEEAASLSLSDVILQVESARSFVEGEHLSGDAPWIGDLVAHAVALQAFTSHEAARLDEIAGVWAHLAGNQPDLATCAAATANGSTQLACEARFAAGARILLADDQMKTVRRLQKLSRKRALTEASLVKEHPQLADWLADGRR